MGLLDKISGFLNVKRKEINLLIIGLDNSGKSSIVNFLKPPELRVQQIVPTVGFNVEKFSTKSLNFSTFDMSGQSKYRNLWEHYYAEANGIIFVIDSSDKMRLVVAKEELDTMLNHPVLKEKSIPLLFFANKVDIRGACSTAEIKAELELNRIRNKPWHLFGSNALSGDGITEGIDWLADELKKNL
jgi:ADP-ribosylation factor-like protein 6